MQLALVAGNVLIQWLCNGVLQLHLGFTIKVRTVKNVSGENASSLDMAGYITFIRVPAVRALVRSL